MSDSVQDGLLNLLCKKGILIQKGGDVFLILQSYKWASLACPVVWVGENLLQVKPGAEIQWIFVYNPDDWEAIPFTVVWRADLGFGLCFQRSGIIERLVKFALRSPGNFVLNDFHVLCDHYGIPNGSSQKTRFGALQLLAFRFGRNDEDYVKEVLEAEGKGKSSACKRNENQSDFMECLLENMNLEERVNFKDLKQEVSSAERYSFAKRQLWNEWKKEKKAEIEVGHLFTPDLLELFIEFLFVKGSSSSNVHRIKHIIMNLLIPLIPEAKEAKKAQKALMRGRGRGRGRARGRGRGGRGRGRQPASAASKKRKREDDDDPDDQESEDSDDGSDDHHHPLDDGSDGSGESSSDGSDSSDGNGSDGGNGGSGPQAASHGAADVGNESVQELDAHDSDSELVAPPIQGSADDVAEASRPGSPAAASHEQEEDLQPAVVVAVAAASSAPLEVHEHSQERMSLPQESEPRLQEADNLHPTAAEESQVEEGGPTAAGSSRDKPKASSPVRAPVVRVHRSPAEILNQLSPPGMMLRMTYNDHRFKVETGSRFHESSSKLKAPYSQKSYSKSFASGAPTWQEALSDVHNHAWTKHNMMVIAGYMVGSSDPQSPGVIPEDVLSDLQPEIEKMPPPKKYG